MRVSYCTTIVRFVLWVRLADPEANVPVTVRVYVFAGVLPPLLLLFPPQPAITKQTIPSNAAP